MPCQKRSRAELSKIPCTVVIENSEKRFREKSEMTATDKILSVGGGRSRIDFGIGVNAFYDGTAPDNHPVPLPPLPKKLKNPAGYPSGGSSGK